MFTQHQAMMSESGCNVIHGQVEWAVFFTCRMAMAVVMNEGKPQSIASRHFNGLHQRELGNMASLNKVIVMGNLGQDPELRYTQNQTAVATLNVATTDVRVDQAGQRQEFTEWHRVVVWSKQAENCAKYLTKGRPVLVEGRLQTRSWEDKTGAKRYTTEIVAQNVVFLGSGGGARADAGASAGPSDRVAPYQGNGPAMNQGNVPNDMPVASASASGMSSGAGTGSPLDEIPF